MAVTIRSLSQVYPDLFYRQAWYHGEAFFTTPLPADHPTMMPAEGQPMPYDPPAIYALPLAVTLVNLYCKFPTHALWRDYFWCADVDAHGQRVYVGGTANGGGFEIHRHLHLTPRWRRALWR